MSISFTKVTWYSQTLAILLFVAVFFFGLYIGDVRAPDIDAESAVATEAPTASSLGKIITAESYSCSDNKYISTLYYEDAVRIMMSDGRSYTLPHVISGSGARYATPNESFVFWNKGNTAFTMENDKIAWDGCVAK